MKRWKTRQYYQLKDFIDIVTDGNINSKFFDVVEEYFGILYAKNNGGGNLTKFLNIFQFSSTDNSWHMKTPFSYCYEQICARHRDDIVFAIDEEDMDGLSSVVQQFFLSFMFIGQNTAEKYSKIIE